MDRKPKKIDLASIEFANGQGSRYVKSAIERARDLEDDSDKECRIKKNLCKSCHYILSAFGGAAMTTQPCGICLEDQMYGSTFTDALCLKCAKENGLCKHCGGDIELKSRRKPYPFMEV